MLTDARVKELALSLFRQESSRDKQYLVGASDFSDPCDFHLASKLSGRKTGEFKYWMGAKLGTAVHEFLEARIPTSDLSAFPEFGSVRIEESIVLGELAGYGVIKSKPDLVFVGDGHLIDWKTSKRDKSKKMQNVIHGLSEDPDATYSLRKYYAQAQIYAWGLNRNNIPVDGCSLVFVNRDGTYDADVWTYTFDYDEAFALHMWERLVAIWSRVSIGEPLDTFERQPACFNCKVLDVPSEL